MTSTGNSKRSLSSADVCSIIEASAKAGVTELLFRDLHVRFGMPPENQITGPILDLTRLSMPGYPVVQQDRAEATVGPLTDKQHEQMGKDSLLQEELRTREDELARLLVEDPVKYEELLRDGDLTDDVDQSDSEDDDI